MRKMPLLPDCKETTRLVLEGEDRQLRLLERAGVGYYRRLARHAEAGVAGRTRLDLLPPASRVRHDRWKFR